MEEAVCGQTEGVNTEEVSSEDKAREQTSAPNTSSTPRKGLRQRGAGRSRAPVSAPSTDVNGAASLSPQSSGRVLRDRSTRTVPAWLKDAKSEDENDEELDIDAAVSKRRKVSNGKRKKVSDCAASQDAGGGLSDDLIPQSIESIDQKNVPDAEGVSPRRPPTQSRAKVSSNRGNRGSAQPVCKTEPRTETPVVEGEKKKTALEIEKKEEEGNSIGDVALNKDPQFQDLTNISSTEEDEAISSDEDVPFRDDLNDQSYDPKGERECPKPKRRSTSRQKDKSEKEMDKCPKSETDIKKEGMESVEEDVKVEEKNVEEPGGPRKRGRRKKDDKTPRLPKRRKKPPVQYVRCEMEGCGTVLAHPRYLQHHIKYQHMLKKKYVCPHPSCGRLFRLQKQLLRHAKHHTDQRDYICEYCARAFKSSHNLAVHRMIHTGEKPLQCEICGFTCRQKASLNWHMKKHDADATYQFSCSICGKKFEKKDCVVAHKAKSHPEVLLAEALAANAGALITTPASLLEIQSVPAAAETSSLEVGQIVPDDQDAAAVIAQVDQQVGHQVVLLGQEQSLHTMQVPVTIALSPIDPPSPADQAQTHLQLQMPVQFVQTSSQSQLSSVTEQSPIQVYSTQQQSTGQPHILQMTFQPVGQLHLQTTSPALVYSPHSQGATSSNEGFILDTPVMSSTAAASSSLQPEAATDSVVWEQGVSVDVKAEWCTQTENGS